MISISTPDVAYSSYGKLSINPPPRYAEVTLDSMMATKKEAAFMAQRYVSALIPGSACGNDLMISAPCGAGKTALCIAIVKAAAEQGIRVLYLTAEDAIHRIMSAEDPVRFFELLSSYHLLVIDDLGSPVIGVSQADAAVSMFQLIDSRYTACKPVVVATEFTDDDLLTEGYGLNSRIVDRIKGIVLRMEVAHVSC